MNNFEPHIRKKKSALLILKELIDAGFNAMLTGGCVRDGLLGIPPKDFDIATNAKPPEIIKLFSQKPFKAIPTGVDHGTVTVVHLGKAFELTTLRKDVSTDGRHANVVFGNSFEEDAKRRDFTVNSLYEDIDGKIHDFTGGVSDLEKKRLVFVGPPEDRIKEDYLRILRFYKFKYRLNFETNQENQAAIHNLSREIKNLSQERVLSELREIFVYLNKKSDIQEMFTNGVMSSSFNSDFPSSIESLTLVSKTLEDLYQSLPSRITKIPHAFTIKIALLFLICEVDNEKAKKAFLSLKPSNTEASLFKLYQDITTSKDKLNDLEQSQKFNYLDDFENILGSETFTTYGIEYLDILSKIGELSPSESKTESKTESKLEDKLNAIIKNHSFFKVLSLLEQKKTSLRKSKNILNGNEVSEISKIPHGKELGEIVKQLRKLQLNEKIATKSEAIKWLKETT